MNINTLGFLRVAAASLHVRVADCDYNVAQIEQLLSEAHNENVQVICFPELCITGYTCGDLFLQQSLQRKAIESLLRIAAYIKQHSPHLIAIVGLPLRLDMALYNVAAVIDASGIMGLIPKTYIPNNNEFYEKRWFASLTDLPTDCSVELGEQEVPLFSQNPIVETAYGRLGIELCEDLWMPTPPSSDLALQGAEVIFNLSASNELVGKHAYRTDLVKQQSARCLAAYVYASAGCGESTTDIVFSGACMIAENGSVLASGQRFSMDNQMIIADVDVAGLRAERVRNTNFLPLYPPKTIHSSTLTAVKSAELRRTINPYPFIPSGEYAHEAFADVFNIQVHGLVKRLQHTSIKAVTIGISGGLDSTLALLVTAKAFDVLQIPRSQICAITMPGFGTTSRTLDNAHSLMQSLGVTSKEISIVDAATQHLKDIEHDINDHNVTYENAQARERTQILMDYANKINGLVVGTGNMSELALGWATYNGDHMSMYGVNTGVPKTLVRSLTRWIADTQMDEASKATLYDIIDTPYSPELLPADKDGKIAQKTEHFVGPYELHDFTLHRVLRYGDSPTRIFALASQAFAGTYTPEIILNWMKVFYRRFFSQQFKRSCLPDGPKVGSVNLSPRGDWRMPSDASATIWLNELETLLAE